MERKDVHIYDLFTEHLVNNKMIFHFLEIQLDIKVHECFNQCPLLEIISVYILYIKPRVD